MKLRRNHAAARYSDNAFSIASATLAVGCLAQ
jgi:hypothetical protein